MNGTALDDAVRVERAVRRLFRVGCLLPPPARLVALAAAILPPDRVASV